MKFRYGIIVAIIVLLCIMFSCTIFGTCKSHCKKKCKSSCNKQIDGFENTTDDVGEGGEGGEPKEEEEDNKTTTEPFEQMFNGSYQNYVYNIPCYGCVEDKSGKKVQDSYPSKCSVCTYPNTKSESFQTFFGNTTENFDNMSKNFNNVSFANPNSSESMLDFFKDIMFSTECCPSPYSTDKGCACISSSKYNILKTRANNNIPFSDF